MKELFGYSWAKVTVKLLEIIVLRVSKQYIAKWMSEWEMSWFHAEINDWEFAWEMKLFLLEVG